jgi:TPR repeat protein
MFENDQGVQQDFAEAKRWYRKTADQGDAEAKTYALRAEEKFCEQQQKAKLLPTRFHQAASAPTAALRRRRAVAP